MGMGNQCKQEGSTLVQHPVQMPNPPVYFFSFLFLFSCRKAPSRETKVTPPRRPLLLPRPADPPEENSPANGGGTRRLGCEPVDDAHALLPPGGRRRSPSPARRMRPETATADFSRVANSRYAGTRRRCRAPLVLGRRRPRRGSCQGSTTAARLLRRTATRAWPPRPRFAP